MSSKLQTSDICRDIFAILSGHFSSAAQTKDGRSRFGPSKSAYDVDVSPVTYLTANLYCGQDTRNNMT